MSKSKNNFIWATATTWVTPGKNSRSLSAAAGHKTAKKLLQMCEGRTWSSSTHLSLRCLAFTWVIWPLEKSNTSSLSSLRMIMLFWQRLSLVRLAPTMSLMKVGQCLGHSCFRIWGQSHVTILFFTLKKPKSLFFFLPVRGSCWVWKYKRPPSAVKVRRVMSAGLKTHHKLLFTLKRRHLQVCRIRRSLDDQPNNIFFNTYRREESLKSSLFPTDDGVLVGECMTDLHTDFWGESSSVFWWRSLESVMHNTEKDTKTSKNRHV